MKLYRWIAAGAVGVLILAALVFAWLYKTVTLVDGSEARKVRTTARTVAGLLHQAGISLREQDQIQPPLNSLISEGEVVTIERARPVRVWADGQVHSLLTPVRSPDKLLEMAGISLSEGDILSSLGEALDLDQPLPAGQIISLQVRRAVPITLELDGVKRNFTSTATTLGEALWEAGIFLHAADRISPSLDTPLDGPIEANLRRSRELAVLMDGQTYPIRSAAPTVGEALAKAGLALQGLDYSMPPEGAPLPEDGIIRLVQVQEEVLLEGRPLPFETEVQADPNMEIDQRGLTNPGAYGLAATRTRVRYEDGQEVSRQVEGEWVALEPQPRVMGYGTKIVIHTLDTPSGAIEYWRAVPMYATSYSPCRIFQDRCDSVTASGATLQKGVAAVSLRHYRSMAYQRVYVSGYGIATILDVGGGIPGGPWIDLGYSDSDYQSWHQWVTVYFLTPVPPEGLIPYVLE